MAAIYESICATYPKSITAAVVTLEGDVISVDSAHNVFVNGIEVFTASPTTTSTLSSNLTGSATAASSGYPASGIGDGVTDSTQGHTSGISSDARSQLHPAATGEPDRSTRNSKRTNSPSSLDVFNVRSTASTPGSLADMVEASPSRFTQHTPTIDPSSQSSVFVSSSAFSVTSIGVDYNLGHDDRRTGSPVSYNMASLFSMTRTRNFATPTQDHDYTGLLGSVAATTDATSVIRTSDGSVLDASHTNSILKYSSSLSELFTTSSMDQHLEGGHISASSTSLSSSATPESAVPGSSSTRSISLNSLTSGSKAFDVSLIRTSSATGNDSPDSSIESSAGIVSGTASENVPDTRLSSETTIPVSPLKSAIAATASSAMVAYKSEPTGSSNHGGGGGIVGGGIVIPHGSANTGGSRGSGSSQPEEPPDLENSSSNASSMEKPSTFARSQSHLASSILSSDRSFATSFRSDTPSAQTSSSAMSRTAAPSSTSSVASVSTNCATCNSCLNINFSPTTTPDLDDGYDGDLRKRRFINRLEKRAAALKTNIVAGQCTVATYTKKPAYPAPRNVVKNERRPARELTAFFATATYWAIPTPATCNGVPGWTYMDTSQIGDLTPPYMLGGNVNPYVSIDHVYEASLLQQFLTDQVAGGFTCSDITTLFDDVNSNTTGTRLNALFGQLASYSNPDLVGIDDALNKFKGSLWNPSLHGWRGVNSANAAVTDYMKELGNLAVAMSFVNDAKVLSLFSSTNARIYQAFLGIDQDITRAVACGNSINDAAGKPMSATWGSAYKAWMTTYIAGQNAMITHTASMYSAAIPTSEPAYSQFIDSFNQRYGAASSLTFPVPQIWPESALTMQKRDGDCTSAQPPTASPTFATSSLQDTKKPAPSHPSSTTALVQAKTPQPTSAFPTFATSSPDDSTKPTITPAASLPSSIATSTLATATTVDQDDRICDNEATGEVGPCDQVGGIMIGKKSSSTGPVPSAEVVPKEQTPKVCDHPSAADAGACAQGANIANGNASEIVTPALTMSTTRSPLPSTLRLEFGGPQGGVVPPPPTQDSDGSGSDEEKPCDPGSPLEILCAL